MRASYLVRAVRPHSSMLAALVLAACSCSSFIDHQAATSTYRILVASVDAAKRQPDVELARDAMPGGLVQLQGFAAAFPDFRGFKELYADALCTYAVAFVFDDFEAAQLAKREREASTSGDDVARIGKRLRALLGACVAANVELLPAAWRTRTNDTIDTLLAGATREQVPAIRRIAIADATLIAIDPAAGFAMLGTTIATLKKCIALAPAAHDADCELVLGSIEAGTSRFFHGDDGSARFAAARTALGEGALMVDVMEARAAATAHGDRAAFEAKLRRVLAADVERWPERRLANELARRKAQRYLDAAEQLVAGR